MVGWLKQLLLRWRDARDARAWRIERLDGAELVWNPRYLLYVRHYYHYCVELFRAALRVHQPKRTDGVPLRLVFDDDPQRSPAGADARRIGLQIEHTLVRPGGGDSAGAPVSQTPLSEASGHYLARVLHRDTLGRCDLVIDYSACNLAHLGTVPALADYCARVRVIAPLLYPPQWQPRPRPWGLTTLFSDPHTGRRARLLAAARDRGLDVRNRKGRYSPERLRQTYLRSRILLNVRRTEDHHTAEELRILPALLCGVVVISEDVPLRTQIPYHRCVIWCSYEELIERAAEVAADYPRYWQQIFGDPELPGLIARMQAQNENQVSEVLSRWLEAPAGTTLSDNG